MPIYEYECSNCGFSYEKISKPGEKEISCPKCSSPNVKKLISNISNGNNQSCNHDCHGCSCH